MDSKCQCSKDFTLRLNFFQQRVLQSCLGDIALAAGISETRQGNRVKVGLVLKLWASTLSSGFQCAHHFLSYEQY